MDIIGIFSSLGEVNRLRIYNILRHKTVCVCELEMLLDLNQAKISRHLVSMRASGLVKRIKTANWIYYEISTEFITKEPELVALLDMQLLKQEAIIKDNVKLEIYLSENMSCFEVKETPGKVFTRLHQNH